MHRLYSEKPESALRIVHIILNFTLDQTSKVSVHYKCIVYITVRSLGCTYIPVFQVFTRDSICYHPSVRQTGGS